MKKLNCLRCGTSVTYPLITDEECGAKRQEILREL